MARSQSLALADTDRPTSVPFAHRFSSPVESPPGAASPMERWRSAADKSRELRDPWAEFLIVELHPEKAKRHRYNAKNEEWVVDDILVKVQDEPFAHGAMRNCFRMKKLSTFASQDWKHASNYVAKRYIKEVDRQTYFDDVRLQMDAKLWGEKFNVCNPPKKVDIIQTYIVEMVDRNGCPVFCVEHLIEGKYIKYNSNSGFVSDTHRFTPQAFSHFTFEKSNHKIIVVDVQGVGDLYTDPQIHTVDASCYGDANLGTKGMALFFASHTCNPICELLQLAEFDLSAREVKAQRTFASSASYTKVPTISAAAAAARDQERQVVHRHVSLSEVMERGVLVTPRENRVSSSSPLAMIGDSSSLSSSARELSHLPSRIGCVSDLISCNADQKEAYRVLGEVHMEVALYHELGRFSDEPNILDALFHVQKAAACGHLRALRIASRIFLQLPHEDLPGVTAEDTPEHRAEGLHCMLKSAECSDRDSMVYMARAFDTGNNLLPESIKDESCSELSRRSWTKAVFWYNAAVSAGQEDPDSIPTMGADTNYAILARLAEMHLDGGHGLERDAQRAGELYSEAAEAATEAMKGKMANKYFMLAEEAWAQVED